MLIIPCLSVKCQFTSWINLVNWYTVFIFFSLPQLYVFSCASSLPYIHVVNHLVSSSIDLHFWSTDKWPLILCCCPLGSFGAFCGQCLSSMSQWPFPLICFVLLLRNGPWSLWLHFKALFLWLFLSDGSQQEEWMLQTLILKRDYPIRNGASNCHLRKINCEENLWKIAS